MKLIDINKIKQIVDFDAGIYYLLLIARKKDNENITHSTEKVIRRVIRNERYLVHAIDELEAIANYDQSSNYKLYISLNPRNGLKAYKNLKENMANWDYEIYNNPDIINKILKISEEWCSCLARNAAKKKYFMLDLDDKKQLEDINILMHVHNIKIEKNFETQNGYHILFTPCDTRNLMKDIESSDIDCELKRDDLLCIGYYEK